MTVLDLIRSFMINRSADIFLFYELSLLYEDNILKKVLLEYLENPLEALQSDNFLNANPEVVCSVYEANEFDSNMAELIVGLENYIEKNQKMYPDIKFQVQRALKGIQFTKLQKSDILLIKLLTDHEKLILYAAKEGLANLISTPTITELSRLSKRDQEVIQESLMNPILCHR